MDTDVDHARPIAPSQNIHWIAPEGGGGPNYPNM